MKDQYNFSELDGQYKLDAIYALDNRELNEFIFKYIAQEMKKVYKNADKRLYELQTGDEAIEVYCEHKKYKFSKTGKLIIKN